MHRNSGSRFPMGTLIVARIHISLSRSYLSIDIRAEEEIVAYDTATRATILHLLAVVENGRLQRPAHRRSVMALFPGPEGERSSHFTLFALVYFLE